MKLIDLANTLEATPEDIVKYYKERRGIEIPLDEEYELSYEIAKKANWRLTSEIFEKYSKTEKALPIEKETDSISEKPKNSDDKGNIQHKNSNKWRTEKNDIEKEISQEFFNWSDKKIFEEILIHNKIGSLILKGRYAQDPKGGKFGFFNDVKHIDNFYLSYPYSFGDIDGIFILSSKLKHGVTYTFEATLAKKKNRIAKGNPFLLQANKNSLQEIIELSEIEKLIENKKVEKTQLELSVQDLIDETEEKKEGILKKIENLKQEKQQEANSIIEEYNETIQAKYSEIQQKKYEIETLNQEYLMNENKLNELLKSKTDMESSIKLLRQKLELCKNLEFISENEADKYLNVLETDSFTHPENHLNFKEAFNSDYAKLSEHIQIFLYKKKGLIYTKFQIQNFLSLLMTHDIIVLSGLSGSGKTQIIKSFAEALGGVAKIIPVKPNWTSSDDLIGYYNPIQSSFLPTPFTEAIVEARQNPNQLYFICLDEMNLARAEYYFADFLSKLEDRENEPEIELFAKHEEELFLSEFSTLLSLFENALKDKNITSWQDFLSDDKARNRFFELLGSMEQETMLKIHSKMKRRLIDILKFPATIKIPSNIRFIGAINVDETTNYFSPKILDRVHIVKFENPLLFESIVASNLDDYISENELKPVYLKPSELGERQELPMLNQERGEYVVQFLKEINKEFLLNLSIDFGVRSIRQAINYAKCFVLSREEDSDETKHVILNTIINQKILPRFVFDGNEILKNGKTKIEVLKLLSEFLHNELVILDAEEDVYNSGYLCYDYLNELINWAEVNNGQINFYA